MNTFLTLPFKLSTCEKLIFSRFCSTAQNNQQQQQQQQQHLEGCLSGIKVLDLSRVLAAPFCSMLLSDLGAEVIKVERLGGGDQTRSWGPPFVKGNAAYNLAINRNKKSIAIDFKKAEGLEIVQRLAKMSDILIENYLPGKLDQAGLGYETIYKINPQIIYCSVSGFGSSGPYKKRAGFDVIAASIGGLMSVTGPEDGEPCKPGVAITDLTTGLFAKGAILAALYQRTRTGIGMKVEANLLSSQVALLTNLGVGYLNTGEIPPRRGTAHENLVPYQAFRCEDGKYITICAGSNEMFSKICEIIFPPEKAKQMIEDKRFLNNSDRVINRKTLIDIMTQTFSTKSLDKWLAAFDNSKVSYGPINELDAVFDDPQVKHNECVIQVEHPESGTVKLIGPAVKYISKLNEVSGIKKNIEPPPMLGQHTVQVLSEVLGYNDDQIRNLKENKIIQCS
ncbi:succinyl-CoA:glutarate CoA-transferase [Brevipalpus obovatus]|uniref:succinyl-CoA:glutarate CoA-transferase n=1 Tax=Brevipalpus obovatus TaxID=246614 RepID=UPI003D9E9F1A